MAKGQQIVTSNERRAGRAVFRKSSKREGVVVPGAVLSPENSEALQRDLAEIGEKQRSAMVSGRDHYLGVKQR